MIYMMPIGETRRDQLWVEEFNFLESGNEGCHEVFLLRIRLLIITVIINKSSNAIMLLTEDISWEF